ncbi:MAG: hypothetical protein WCQ00_02995 [bacterium]
MNNSKQEITEELIKRMSMKIHSAYVSYLVWKWLEQSRNINAGEERAYRNVEVMNHQSNFFHVALQGSFYSFILDLSVFFDKQKPALSLENLLLHTNTSEENIEKIKAILAPHDKIIQQIKKDIRDKDVAHFDIGVDRTKPNMILYKETEDLFAAVQEVFNLISENFNGTLYFCAPDEESISFEMEYLLDNLEKGENKRKEDIYKNLPLPENVFKS